MSTAMLQVAVDFMIQKMRNLSMIKKIMIRVEVTLIWDYFNLSLA